MSDALFTLGSLDIRRGAAAPATLKLEHPVTGAPLPGWEIQLLSADSDEYKKVQRALSNRRLKEAGNRLGRIKLTAESAEADTLDLLAAVTKGWAGIIADDGKPLEYSAAAALELYKNHTWIREQAGAFIADRSNFLGNS